MQIRYPMTLSLTIPFFGYNSSEPTKKDEPVIDVYKDLLKQKLVEADQLFLVNKYEDVVHMLEKHKVIINFNLLFFEVN